MKQQTKKVYVSDDSIMRLEAYIRMDLNPEVPTANCEDCCAPIPVELSKCDRCAAVRS